MEIVVGLGTWDLLVAPIQDISQGGVALQETPIHAKEKNTL